MEVCGKRKFKIFLLKWFCGISLKQVISIYMLLEHLDCRLPFLWIYNYALYPVAAHLLKGSPRETSMHGIGIGKHACGTYMIPETVTTFSPYQMTWSIYVTNGCLDDTILFVLSYDHCNTCAFHNTIDWEFFHQNSQSRDEERPLILSLASDERVHQPPIAIENRLPLSCLRTEH
jgi:hypothetical protein